MGIDIYMEWDGMTEADRAAQVTGFSVKAGHVGYLREAYHGEPYATSLLVPEAFADNAADGVEIPASRLEDRLPSVLEAASIRERTLYHGDDGDVMMVQRAYIDFVALAKRKEEEQGHPVRIIASY